MRRIHFVLLFSSGILGCTTPPPAMAQSTPSRILPRLGGEEVRAQSPDQPVIPASPTAPVQQNVTQVSGSGGITAARVIARVNGTPILHEEIINATAVRIEDLKKQYPNEDFRKYELQIQERLLDEIIDREVILQDIFLKVNPQAVQSVQSFASKEFENQARKEMEKLGLKTIDELKEYHKKNGRSFDMMRRQMERSTIAQEWIKNLIIDKINQINREDMLTYYKANQEEFNKKERLVWQHIFIDVDRYKTTTEAKHQAEVVWQMAKNCRTDDDFGKIAQQHSHSLFKTGRAIGTGQFKGEIEPKELEAFLFQLKEGEQGPLIEMKKGFYIVRVTQHEYARMIPFEEACPMIKNKLSNLLVDGEMKRIVKEMKEKAFIERNVAGK